MEELRKTSKVISKIKGYDAMQEHAITELGILNYVYRPSLVQHIGGNNNLIGNIEERHNLF